MTHMDLSRRQVLGSAVAAVSTAVMGGARATDARVEQPAAADAQRQRPASEPFGYCLNTSTIRGNGLDIVGVITAASKAGFHAIEPWLNEIDAYTQKGGTLADLRKRIA